MKTQSPSARSDAKSDLRVSLLVLAIFLSSASLCLAQGTTGSNLSTNAGLPTNQLVATVQLGSNVYPEAVVVSPDSKTAYVTSFSTSNGHFLSIIDTQTATVADTIPLPGSFNPLVISPDGSTLYIGNANTANPSQSAVTVISAATKTVTATITMAAPIDMAMSPDGKNVYITDNNAVSIIQTATNTVTLDAINVAAPAGNIAISPDGKSAYVSTALDTVSVIDLTSGKVIKTIQLSATNALVAYLTFSPDGKRLYMARHKVVFVVDTTTKTIVAKIGISLADQYTYAGQTDITPDGKFLYVPFANSDEVLIVNTATKKVARKGVKVSYPEVIAVAPTATFAYAIGITSSNTGEEGNLYVIDISPE